MGEPSRRALARMGAAAPWVALIVGSLLLAPGGAGAGRQASLDPAAVDAFIARQMRAARVPGLALAITRGEEVLYVRGYGLARPGEPVTPETQFLVGSLSKSFTALAVMQLVEAGRVDLDTPVQTYLPEFTLADPASAARITVRHLLNQTSGLADAGYPPMQPPHPATPAERLADLARARPVAPPGVEYHYHNVNYEILARLVEVAGGQEYSDYLAEHVFSPLGMADTLSILTHEDFGRPERLAQGHLNLYGFPVADAEEEGFLGGSGGVVTTAADMARWLIVQASGGRLGGVQVLSPEGVALMHTPPEGIDSDYAMGWIATTRRGVPALEHNGILSTFYADMALLPESGHGIALLYNVQSLAQVGVGFPPIMDGLIDVLTGREPRPPRFTVGALEALFGALTLVGAVQAARRLWRLPAWRAWARTVMGWRLAPGIIWALLPAAFLAAMPRIVLSSSGRAFGYRTLARSMPEVTVWLGLTGALGLVDVAARLAHLVRRGRKEEVR